MYLKRNVLQKLNEWQKSKIRSPLLLLGARQVGKSTVLKVFAESLSDRIIEINFWRDNLGKLKNIFINNGDAFQIMKEIKDHFSLPEIDFNKTVLIIDEIQECPEAYSSLKSFKEQIPQLKILATGSYLQLFLKNEKLTKLPVGCVDEITLYPMNFDEFLQSSNPELYKKFQKISLENFEITESLHNKLMQQLFEYFFVGGLPEIVLQYCVSEKNQQTRAKIRTKQKNLLNQYIIDFQKYGKSIHIKKIDKLFQTIPKQLEQYHEESVNRFQYKDLGANANFNNYFWPFSYLANANLIIRSFIVSNVQQPHLVHEEKESRNIFKCYFFDIGLLNASLNTPYEKENIGSYKGFIAENFVAQELYSLGNYELINYKKNSKKDSAEIEFLITDKNNKIIPIEVKSSSKSLKAKSLDVFVNEYSPTKAFKLTPTRSLNGELGQHRPYTSLPIYMISKFESL